MTAHKKPTANGFDSHVVSREDDHLVRWPFAKEIYGIATTCPNEWSARIGIYGEWGTGKSTVLEFVKQMAERDNHVVVLFNPWQYDQKDALWKAFVLEVIKAIEAKLGGIAAAGDVRRKIFFSTALSPFQKILKLWKEEAGTAAEQGLDFVRKMLDPKREELRKICELLDKRKVIVMVDDLDRTSGELVPEILFALKQLMDIPGFSFICAFDPVVVGQVLGKKHEGFGDGLKFLEKIIDYPRWLPPAPLNGLINLGCTEAHRWCGYVPQTALRDIIPLLPSNPRAVRQFIRLLALLKPQVSRHYDSELTWPAILAANVLKVRYPLIAHELLTDTVFWDSIGMLEITERNQNPEEKLKISIDAQITKVCTSLGKKIEQPERGKLEEALKSLASRMGLFGGLHGESVSYQFNIAEAPAAVTWKEYDEFLIKWEPDQTASTAKRLISKHALQVEQNEIMVYRELLVATIERYSQTLRKGDNAYFENEKPHLVSQAESLFKLLEVLIFDVDIPANRLEKITKSAIIRLAEEWAALAGNSLPIHKQFWPRNENLILRLFKEWPEDVTPLIQILTPFNMFNQRVFTSGAAIGLHKSLCREVLPIFGRQIIASLYKPESIQRLYQGSEGLSDAGYMIWDGKGVIWTTLRQECLKTLEEAQSNYAIQGNAYGLLHWFTLRHSGNYSGDIGAMRALFAEQSIFDYIWKAATATPLAPRAVYQIRGLPDILKQLNINFNPPAWWRDILTTLIIPASSAVEETPPSQSEKQTS